MFSDSGNVFWFWKCFPICLKTLNFQRFLPEKTCFEKEIPQRNSSYPRNYSKWRARVGFYYNEFKPYVVKYDVIEGPGVYLPPMCLEPSEEWFVKVGTIN